MAFQISLTSRSSEIIREYKEGIPLEGPYEVGLKHFTFWNTVYNVTSNNNSMKLIHLADKGSVVHMITIPEGIYELDDILNFLVNNNDIQESRTSFSLSKTTFKMKIYTEWIIDFREENSIGKLFGISKQLMRPYTTIYSDRPVDIFNINTVKICCNLIRANIDDLKRNVNTLYDFPLDTAKSGSKIIKEPNPICYFGVHTDKIYELVIRITDQNDNLIDFRGELINLTLDFRPLRLK